MAAEIKRIDGKACVATALLCEYFGITRQALNKWEKRGCPKAARGYWCVKDVLAWKDEAEKQADSEVEDMPITLQKVFWETRCKEAQTENQQFKNAVLRGDYLEKLEVERELATFFVSFKQAALSLPRKAAITAAQYVGNERARSMEHEMAEVITNVLTGWSGGTFMAGVDPVGAGVAAPAGTADGEPVGGRKPRNGRKKQQ